MNANHTTTTLPLTASQSVRLALIRDLAASRGTYQAAKAAFFLGIPMWVVVKALATRPAAPTQAPAVVA